MREAIHALRFISLDEVATHEWHDPRRVASLTESLRQENILRNPPIVARAKTRYVVLDGTTRIQALRDLGCRDVLAQVVEPDTPGFRLSTWHHLVTGMPARSILNALRHLNNADLVALTPDEAIAMLSRRELACYAILKDIGFYGLRDDLPHHDQIAILNQVVDIYRSTGEVSRMPPSHMTAALDDHPTAQAIFAFPQYSHDEVLHLAENGARVPPGITRFIIPTRMLGLNVDMGLLRAQLPLECKNQLLEEYLAECITQGKLRLYEEPVLVIEERKLTMPQGLRSEVLLGNGAIARGLVESDCRMVTAYPGTPSTEILTEVVRFKRAESLGLYVEWSVNEKVALETALAASIAGQRAAVAMKQVGLNVASDALLSAAYTGVVGGLVVIACDDPGPYSSQTEQDTRLFALFAKVPVLDPSSPREAKAMSAAAFDLSEQFQIPVILRPTTRVCHAIQNIELEEVTSLERKAAFKKDPARWAATPRFRNVLHKELNQKLEQVEAAFEGSPFNQISGPTGSAALGIIAAGVCATVVSEILDEADLSDAVPVLRIGTPYPLPQKLVAGFVARCQRVLVLEEPDAAIEIQIRDRRSVSGRLDSVVPSAGELTPEVVYAVLGGVLAETGVARLAPQANPDFQTVASSTALPPRAPQLCPGCGHRSAFFAVKRALPRAIFPGDIGCYTLGINQRAVDTVIDMGAAITVASGLYHAYRLDGEDRPIVATIGDSTFIHAGVPALINAVHTGARFVLLILDNGTAAMTGLQPTAQSRELAFGTTDQALSLKHLVIACGVQFVREADPYDYDSLVALLTEANGFASATTGGVAVIIAKRACVLYDRSPVDANPVRVEITAECDGCKYCLTAFGCPAMALNADGSRVDIDPRLCIDCGECIESCYKGFIVPAAKLVDLVEA